MITALIVTAIGLAAAIAALVALAATHSTTLLAARCRRKVLVTLKSEDAFAGVLYATDREALVLREAEALAYGARKTNVPVEGELVVLRADVAYLQVLPSETPARSGPRAPEGMVR